ncbi:hypothetical protein HOP50_06g45050 [Chloropicon primus]|nr:hypothetical protein HOP50_06g45050 [Chloropicon primus]
MEKRSTRGKGPPGGPAGRGYKGYVLMDRLSRASLNNGRRPAKLMYVATALLLSACLVLVLQSLRGLPASGDEPPGMIRTLSVGGSAGHPKEVEAQWSRAPSDGSAKPGAAGWSNGSLISPSGDTYDVLSRGSSGVPERQFPGISSEGGESKGYDIVVLTSMNDVKGKQNSNLLLCNCLWSIVATTKPERVSVIWNGAKSERDFEIIREFTVQCNAATAPNVVHLMEPSNWSWKPSEPNTRAGPAFLSALRTQRGRKAHTVFLEGDTEVLPGFEDKVRHWINCMGDDKLVKLYQASDFEATDTTLGSVIPREQLGEYMDLEESKNRGLVQGGLQTVMPLVNKQYKGCLEDTLVGGVGTWFNRGSQSMLFGPGFLERFLKNAESKKEVENGDMEIGYFCVWHPKDCFMTRVSLVQHLGLSSFLFGNGKSNSRFHHAQGIPLAVGTIVNNTAAAL